MGTKQEPGQFDCYDKAAPDEPLFTMLSRDPLGAEMVFLWAALRIHDFQLAANSYAALVNRAAEMAPTRRQKSDEALQCGTRMAEWRLTHGGPAFRIVLR